MSIGGPCPYTAKRFLVTDFWNDNVNLPSNEECKKRDLI
jgi:hypothetical protein